MGIEYSDFEKLADGLGAGFLTPSDALAGYAAVIEGKAAAVENQRVDMEGLEAKLIAVEAGLKNSVEALNISREIDKQLVLNQYRHPAGDLVLHTVYFKPPVERVCQTAPEKSVDHSVLEGRPANGPRRQERNRRDFFNRNRCMGRV